VAFVFNSTLQSKAKKGAKNTHSEAVKKGQKNKYKYAFGVLKKGAKKNTSGFATPLYFLLLFSVFSVQIFHF
jgi:hypothetical protein